MNANEYKCILAYITYKEVLYIISVTHKGTFAIKNSMFIHLNRDYELFQIKEDKTFYSFYTRCFDIVKISYNIGRHINEEKKVKKVSFSVPTRLRENIKVETSYKVDDFKIHSLVGDLQALGINHFFPKKVRAIVDKGNNLALNSTKIRINNEKITSMISEESSSLDEEEMALIAKMFVKFMKIKNNFSRQLKRERG